MEPLGLRTLSRTWSTMRLRPEFVDAYDNLRQLLRVAENDTSKPQISGCREPPVHLLPSLRRMWVVRIMAASSTCAKVVSKYVLRLTTRKTVAVIVAGGIGGRFGYRRQAVSVCGLPLMSWSILAFDRTSVAHIVIAALTRNAAVQKIVVGKLVLLAVHFATSGAAGQESVTALQVVPAGYDFVCS